jgi:outer membrane immunogenic protein
LGTGGNTGAAYGGFIGYNWELDSIVVGIDAAYNYTTGITTRSGPSTLSRVVTTSDSTTWTISINGRSRLTLQDWATLRARVGAPMGQFLPYAFLGASVARFDYRTRTTVSASSGGPTFTRTGTEAESDAFSPGLTTGLGVDIAILPNMYLRAEYEFNAFMELAGIRPITHTGKVGLGFRF